MEIQTRYCCNKPILLKKCWTLIINKGRLSDLHRVAKASNSKHIRTLTPEQILQVLPIALGQLKAGNISEN